MQIIEEIQELLKPIAAKHKYYIVDVIYRKEAGKNVLRITVDKEAGVTLNECARFNNELSELFDKENLIDEEYLLEVSSPGLDRKLKKDEDFIWAVGKKVKLTTYVPIDGNNTFIGTLLGLGDNCVVLEKDGVSTEIPREKIASAKLAMDIDWSKT